MHIIHSLVNFLLTTIVKKILVVDDNRDILEIVEIILKNDGYGVKTLLDGNDTYQAVDSYKPDVILLDVCLGSSDGREICKKLKNANLTKHIPVIMFSANVKSDDVSKECKANDFIAKPFDIQNLLTKVHALA